MHLDLFTQKFELYGFFITGSMGSFWIFVILLFGVATPLLYMQYLWTTPSNLFFVILSLQSVATNAWREVVTPLILAVLSVLLQRARAGILNILGLINLIVAVIETIRCRVRWTVMKKP